MEHKKYLQGIPSFEQGAVKAEELFVCVATHHFPVILLKIHDLLCALSLNITAFLEMSPREIYSQKMYYIDFIQHLTTTFNNNL